MKDKKETASANDRARELKKARDARYRAKKAAAKKAQPKPAEKKAKEPKRIVKAIEIAKDKPVKVPSALAPAFEQIMTELVCHFSKRLSHIFCSFADAIKDMSESHEAELKNLREELKKARSAKPSKK